MWRVLRPGTPGVTWGGGRPPGASLYLDHPGVLLRETDPSVVTCGLPTLRPVPDCQLEKDDVGTWPNCCAPGGRLVPDELASDERVPDEYGDYSPDPCQVNLCLVGVGVAPPDLCPMSVSSPSPSLVPFPLTD